MKMMKKTSLAMIGIHAYFLDGNNFTAGRYLPTQSKIQKTVVTKTKAQSFNFPCLISVV